MREERTEEEEREYRRYLHRLKRREERRRRVMIARAVAGGLSLLLLVLVISLVRLGVHAVMDHGKEGRTQQVEVTAEPTIAPLEYSVPEGFESYASALEDMRDTYPEVENILLNLYEYTDSMLNLAVNNTDALEFVAEYPKHKSDTKASGEVTQEELSAGTNGIPCFQQWDTRWGYLTYGNDNIGINGCGPTSLSMVAAGLLQDTSMSPDAVAEFSVENNYCTPASGSAWTLMSSGAQKLGLESKSVVVSVDAVKAELQENHPVILSMGPGDFTTTGHFIVLAGLTEQGKAVVYDPNSITRSAKRWGLKKLIKQAKAAWSYTVP